MYGMLDYLFQTIPYGRIMMHTDECTIKKVWYELNTSIPHPTSENSLLSLTSLGLPFFNRLILSWMLQ